MHMRRIFAYSIFGLLFVWAWPYTTKAQDYVVPAGTLLHCTLDEPNFSSATATVGDPFVCQLKSLSQFGHSVMPRGAYLTGHLEAEKEPGHFVGKGFLKLEFDRVCLPNTCIPVPGKIVAVQGYRVDRQGDVMGHGHATRDGVEWMLPPLWPWKVLTLPARGPRPTLKGEVPITLRLMDDIEIPKMRTSTDTPNRPPYAYHQPRASSAPVFHRQPEQWSVAPAHKSDSDIRYLPPTTPAMERMENADGVAATLLTPARREEGNDTTSRGGVTLIALKSDTIFPVASYRISSGQLNYVRASGLTGAVELSEVDWRKTSQLNRAPDVSPAQQTP
jgi:hypothetical protein